MVDVEEVVKDLASRRWNELSNSCCVIGWHKIELGS